MNIFMLGHSGVGKTTYMASMYGTLQKPVHGFSIRAVDYDDHNRLVALHESIQCGVYPSSSNQRETYAFELLYEGEKIFDFNWTDYRGGALMESSRGSQQAEVLHGDLKSADGILAFFDCTALESRRGHFSEIRRSLLLLNTAMREITHRVPLALVMAKADLAPDPGADFFEPLNSLVETVQSSKHVVGSVIPIACGEEDVNVALPALFALCIGISVRRERLIEDINEMIEKRDKYREKATLWDWVSSKWDGLPTYGDMAEDKQRELLAEYAVFKRLEEPVDALQTYLEKVEEVNVF